MSEWEEYRAPEEDGEGDDVCGVGFWRELVGWEWRKVLFLQDFVGFVERENLLLVIDVRAEALERKDGAEPALLASLRCALAALKQKVRHAGASDRVGVVLMGSRVSRNADAFDNVFVLVPLEAPSGASVRAVRDLLEDVSEHVGSGTAISAGLGAKEGVSEERGPRWSEVGCMERGSELRVDLALWVCQTMIGSVRGGSRSAASARSKRGSERSRLWMFTPDEEPGRDARLASRRAAQLHTLGVDAALFAMAASDSFSLKKYWGAVLDVFTVARVRGARGKEEEEEEEDEDAVEVEDLVAYLDTSDFGAVLEAIESRVDRKRTYARLPIRIGDGVEMAALAYMLQGPTRVPPPTHVEAERSAPLVSRRRLVESDSGMPVARRDLETALSLGSAGLVAVSKREVDQLKWVPQPPGQREDAAWSKAGVRILGFASADRLIPELQIRSPLFLYPDDKSVAGSTRAMRGLMGALERKNAMAIAVITPRAGLSPALAALVPQRFSDDPLAPPAGLHAVFLPWADDLRRERLPPATAPPSQAADAAKDIVSRAALSERAGPGTFPNPALSLYYTVAQAIVLSDWDITVENINEHCTDEIRPNPAIHERIKQQVQAFQLAIPLTDAPPSSSSRPRTTAGTKRKQRPEDADEIIQAAKVARTDNLLSKYTVPQLKEILRSLGKPISGKKAELLQRVEEFLQ